MGDLRHQMTKWLRFKPELVKGQLGDATLQPPTAGHLIAHFRIGGLSFHPKLQLVEIVVKTQQVGEFFTLLPGRFQCVEYLEILIPDGHAHIIPKQKRAAGSEGSEGKPNPPGPIHPSSPLLLTRLA